MQNKDEFFNIIKSRIDDKASKNKRLEYLKKKIESKKATFADTAEYSEIISNITGSTFSNFVSKMNTSGTKSYICEELLKIRYADMNAVMSEVQKSLDEKTGINIAPQQADFPIDRVRKVASSLEDTTVSQDVIERRANSAVSNVSKSFHDDYIQENAEFRSDAGIKCTITRTALGKCCAWCDAVCGTYVYGEEPEDIYRRHDNCSCTVIFENGRTAQDVWSKKTWEKPSGSNDYEPTSLSTEQAKALQDKNMPKPFTNDDKSGIIKENNDVEKIGSDLFDDKAREKLYQNERIIATNKYETAIVYDSNGNIIFKKKGNIDSVQFTQSEKKKMKGCVVTHNHPKGSSFSAEDIFLFKNMQLSELRAVCVDGTYVIRPPKKWSDEITSVKDIDDKLNKIYSDIGSQYRDIAANKGEPFVKYLRTIETETTKQFCDTYGLIFKWEAKI